MTAPKRTRRFQVKAVSSFYGTQMASPRLAAELERRVREIAEENAMTLSETVADALRCYVVLHDRGMGAKR